MKQEAFGSRGEFLRKIEQEISLGEFASCMIESTSYCNAQCSFCENPNLTRTKCHMSRETFEKVLERLREDNINPRLFFLHCCGEPLLDPELFYKIGRIKESFKSSEVGYTTNFSIANQLIINNIFESGQDFIAISLNSVDSEEYHSIMGLEYYSTIRNINMLLDEKEARKSKINITLSIVADKNTDAVERFQEYWKDRAVKVRIMRRGDWVKREYNKRPSVEDTQCYREMCGWLYNKICILSDGRYGMCCFDAEGSKALNIYDTGIIAAMQTEYRREIRKRFLLENELPDMCHSCSYAKEKAN